jgi:hypothetical protein
VQLRPGVIIGTSPGHAFGQFRYPTSPLLAGLSSAPFDHVPPPAAPAGTAGEYLTTLPSAADGIAGPVGLGFRTPARPPVP